MFSDIWGQGNGRGISPSGFAVNRGAVYRGFTVYTGWAKSQFTYVGPYSTAVFNI